MLPDGGDCLGASRPRRDSVLPHEEYQDVPRTIIVATQSICFFASNIQIDVVHASFSYSELTFSFLLHHHPHRTDAHARLVPLARKAACPAIER